jgi:hypothetical protein
MKKSRFRESQIVAIRKEATAGVTVAEIAKLKRIYIELALENTAIKDLLHRKP